MVCRKYSGVDHRAWNPSSTPAITRLIEGLDGAGHDTRVLFLAKDDGEDAAEDGYETDFARFRHVRARFLGWRGGQLGPAPLRNAINTLRHVPDVLRAARQNNDVIYVDRGNLAYAALLALLGHRVVWRCLGVMPYVLARHAANPLGRVYFHFCRLMFRTPIRLIVCTFDGSPWSRVFVGANIRRKLVLLANGVDRPDTGVSAPPAIQARPAGVPAIVFIGRMVASKGVMPFSEALVRLHRQGLDFRVAMIGYGPLLEGFAARIAAEGLSDKVACLGRQPQREVAAILAASDIFVTLSAGGTFGNTTLEAMAAGACVVGLGQDAKTGIDETTAAAVPNDVLARVDRSDIVGSLTETLVRLIKAPGEIARRKSESRCFADAFLPTWHARVAEEIRLIESVAAGRRPEPSRSPFAVTQRSASP